MITDKDVMKIKKVPIDLVFENPDNPRKIDKHGMERLKISISETPELFNARPILCIAEKGGKFKAIGGNQRLAAAKELGWEEIPVIIMPTADEAKIKEWIVKDNGEFGEWDFEKLVEWDDLPLEDWGIDLPNAFRGEVEIMENGDDSKANVEKNECPKCGFRW